MSDRKLVSIIVPVKDEEGNIGLLHTELTHALREAPFNYEIIVIEDGSRDQSWVRLQKVAQEDPRVKIVRFGKNMGMTQAYQCGFLKSKGDYVLTFSSDVEIDPKEILHVVAKLEEGFDVVNTNRVGRWQGRKSSFLRTLPSMFANELIAKITGVKLKDNGSGLKGFKRFVVDNLKLYGEMHRYCAAYCSLFTDKIIEIDVEYRDRVAGASKYGSLSRTLKVFFDLFSLKFLMDMSRKPYKMMPGRLFGSVGLAFFMVGAISVLYLIFEKIVFGADIGGRPMLTLSGVAMTLGVQLIMMGFLGEIMMRVYFDTGNKTVYTIKETINIEE
ncbi:hypothetical protein A3K34_03870 [candidate division WWE3 bacterium RIFOXYC1_FULL_40_10]|nr:MAG: hypothetical protein A3K58_03870 [candidate division WWE3 bacterium RIFOXYB1_FULL_40_22]OGC61978.1 MAG: hypothetical protein A3K37_03870 [candidate division WWE3 bacterium RIFOXYA1_FULL_40_11]OGC66361.1 MAG: hypothetical protein A3K34_03870 [candidate division WWE3 bacterium RIFOXYC1_FULL_40_10]OGC67963.1 MAG: hypothetical protein A2450_02060 [candidate division WWE3 bacterium RIFOXYC2_FULL_40_11]OGC70266.1 MAG: hypothetical protein A2602_04310 [candidate division WWE3 bacterium RIFOXYD